LILLTLAGLQFINLVDFMIVMPLGPQLQADLGIRAHQFGWIVSSYTLAAGIAGFFAADWPRRTRFCLQHAASREALVVFMGHSR